jgi:glucuronosyltransferase
MQEFMDSATNGVIFMSFGSTLKSSVMKPEMVDTILGTFRGLAPIKFIRKWDGMAQKDLPTNVLLTVWAPQQDLLGHWNLKVFVTHGGLSSIIEVICHNTVLVGSPFNGDQFANVAIVVQNRI